MERISLTSEGTCSMGERNTMLDTNAMSSDSKPNGSVINLAMWELSLLKATIPEDLE